VPGLTFLNSLFLAGLAAASLPVIIHLLHRRPATRVDFSWLKFVSRLQPSRTRRVKMKDLLLLAVRILLIAVLSLALARPTLKGALGGTGEDRARTTACLILDDSYSLGARAGDGRLFDRARARALEAVSLLRPGDDAMLVLGGRPARVVIGEPTRDLDFVKRKIEDLEVSARGTDFPGALAEARRRLGQSANLNKEIYLFTDSQAVGWAGADTGRVDIGGNRVSLYWVTVGPLPEQNVAVERVERVETLGQAAGATLLQAVVRNLGPQPRKSVLVTLESGGETKDQALVDLDAAAAVSVLLRMEERDTGPAVGLVRTAEDALPADDVRYFRFSGTQAIRALVVGAGSTIPGARSPGFFIRKALDPTGDGSSGIRVSETAPGEISSGELESADVVILADIPRIEPAQVELLGSFVRRGGGLLVLAGPSLDLGFYNRTFLPEFLDLTLVGPYGEGEGPGFFQLRLLRPGHPIFAALQGEAPRLLEEVHFRRVMQLEAGSGASVLAEFSGVGPALVEGSREAGRVLFFASSGDPLWSDFPLTGAFVPVVHEIVRYLAAAAGSAEGSVAVGSSASVPLPGGGGGALVGVDPRGDEVMLEPQIVDGRPRVRWDDLEQPGIYRLRSGEEEVGRFAVNVTTEESSLETVGPEGIAPRIASERVRFIGPGEEMQKEIATLRYGRELGPGLLWVAFGLLAVESLLIRGGRKSDGADRLRREIFR
jgi:hypothetical protein